MNLVWSDKAWEDYLYWQTHDRKLLKRINLLIEDEVHIARCRYHYGKGE